MVWQSFVKKIVIVVCWLDIIFAIYGKQLQTVDSFVWKIDEKIDEFINAKNGYRVTSKIMKLNNLELQLHFYPNGKSAEEKDSFFVYLCVNNLSEKLKISSVFLDFNIFIHEIDFSWIIRGRHYSDTSKCRGAYQNNARILKSLTKDPLKSIMVSITFNMKQIISSKHIIDKEIPINIKRYNNLLWNIKNEDILQEMRLSQHQQTYISNVFDNLWFMSLSPNGYHETFANKLDMFLHLIYLPKEISKLVLQCKFHIFELNIYSEFQAEFNNDEKGWGPSKKFSTNILLKKKNLKQLSLNAKCEMLKVFDKNGKQMILGPQWKYFKVYNRNDYAKRKIDVETKFAEQTNNDDTCLAATNYTMNSNEEMYNVLNTMSMDIDMLRQQLFVSIGMFTVHFGFSAIMFTMIIGMLCCGCFQ